MSVWLTRNHGVRKAIATSVALSVALTPTFGIASSSGSAAAATDISNVSLLTAAEERAKPNFFFIFDDSTSMNNEYMPGPDDPKSTGALHWFHAGSYSTSCNKSYWQPTGVYEVPPSSSGYPGLATKISNFSAVPEDGFGVLNKNLRSLAAKFYAFEYEWSTGAFHYSWTPKAGGPKEPQDTDCFADLGQYANPKPSTPPATVATANGVWTKVPVGAGEQQSFATWYAFYRTRLNIMKSAAALAFSSDIANDSIRVGFITINPTKNNVHWSKGGQIDDDKFLPIRDFTPAWRDAWLNKLYRQFGAGNTPLLSALSRAGNYYAGVRGNGSDLAYRLAGQLIDRDAESISKPFKSGDRPDPVQYSCQRNYSFLTTDGFWSSRDDGVNEIGIGLPTHSKNYGQPMTDSPDSGTIASPLDLAAKMIPMPINDKYRLFRVNERERRNGNFYSNQASFSRDNAGNTDGLGESSKLCNVRLIGPNQVPGFDASTKQYGFDASGRPDPADKKYNSDIQTHFDKSGKEWQLATFAELWHIADEGYCYEIQPKGYRELLRTPDNPRCDTKRAGKPNAKDAAPGTMVMEVANRNGTLVYRRDLRGSAIDAAEIGPVSTFPPMPGTRLNPPGIPGVEKRWEKETYFVGCVALDPGCSPAEKPGEYTCTTVDRGAQFSGWAIGSETPTNKPPVEMDLAKDYEYNGRTEFTLADVAMYFYQANLRPASVFGTLFKDGLVPVKPELEKDPVNNDTNKNVHMTTFTMGLGVSGFLNYTSSYWKGTNPDFEALRKGADADDLVDSGGKGWMPLYRVKDKARIDDLWHAAVNGRGRYFQGATPTETRKRIEEAIIEITKAAASGGAPGLSNIEPMKGDNIVFFTSFNSGVWNGDLEMDLIDVKTGKDVKEPVFASERLAAKVKESCDDRSIYLFTGNRKRDFAWETKTCATSPVADLPIGSDPDLAPLSIAKLKQSQAISSSRFGSEGNDSDLVNFLRGQWKNEARDGNAAFPQRFRERKGAQDGVRDPKTGKARSSAHLGDFIGSQPQFVGKPVYNYVDPGYADFRTKTRANGGQADRPPMVYVGGNDGMLHAFSVVLDKSELPVALDEAWAAIPSGLVPELYRLALPGYAAGHRFFVDGTPSIGDVFDPAVGKWKTILVIGYNAGGRGYMALDVTEGDNRNAVTPLWELGLKTDAGINLRFDEDLGQTFGNPLITKVRDAKVPGGKRWVVIVASGYNTRKPDGYLYVLDAISGEVLKKLKVPANPPSGKEVGLAKINGYVNNLRSDNTTEAVYGGDLLGNVWRFDFSKDLADVTEPTGPLAVLADDKGVRQSVTSAPELGYNSKTRNRMVFVGTGRFLGDTDIDATGLVTNQRQTMYGIVDTGTTANIARGDLTRRTFSGIQGSSNQTTVLDGAAKDAGWYIDLPIVGERIMTDPSLQLGILVFPSNVPGTEPCQPKGRGFLNFVDFRTGAPIESNADLRAREEFPDSMIMGTAQVRTEDGTVSAISSLSKGELDTTKLGGPVGGPGGKRMSWREVVR